MEMLAGKAARGRRASAKLNTRVEGAQECQPGDNLQSIKGLEVADGGLLLSRWMGMSVYVRIETSRASRKTSVAET